MIVHGYSPDGLSISTIQPLVKNKRKSLSDSSNFRVISLSSPVAKIFDWVILNSNTENPMTIRCLLYIANQRLNITWNIYVTVCQAIFRHQMVSSKVVSYILSPILFGIYIDEMLLRLKPIRLWLYNRSFVVIAMLSLAFNDVLLNTLTQGMHLDHIVGPNIAIKEVIEDSSL